MRKLRAFFGFLVLSVLVYWAYDYYFSNKAKDRAIAAEMCDSVSIGMSVEDLQKIESRSRIPFIHAAEGALIRYGAWKCVVFLENGEVVALPEKPWSEH
tara:strand:- start:1537 stop:1833 length:297 start_codon:yes stop_codon:yes gene_type:complete